MHTTTLTETHTTTRPETSSDRRAPVPPAPSTIEATGIGRDQIAQLLVKMMYGGEATGLMLATRLRLPYAMIEPIIEHVRAERIVEVRGAAGSGTAGFRYALTDLGRDRAAQYFAANQYVARVFRISSSFTMYSGTSARRSTPARRCSCTDPRGTASR
jgi:hypothetical protein